MSSGFGSWTFSHILHHIKRTPAYTVVFALSVLCLSVAPWDAVSLSATPTTTIAVSTTTTIPPISSNCKVTSGTPWSGGTPERKGVLGPAPHGIVAVDIYSTTQAEPFVASVVGSNDIAGIDLAIQWCNVEPLKGLFNWGPIVSAFQLADQYDKFVTLTVIPGFETPAWALKGVAAVHSSWAYSGNIDTRTLPLPWDKTYLSNWYGFLRDLAEEFGNNPEFRMIEVGGPTSVSTELSLPDSPNAVQPSDTGLMATVNGVTSHYGGSDLAMWGAEQYTTSAYLGAWRATFAAYHQMFPNQYLAVSLFPGLRIAMGGCDTTCESVSTPLEVVAAGKVYAKYLSVQEDGLSGNGKERDPMYNTVKANCGRVLTGLQTKAPGNASQPPQDGSLLQALENGAGGDVSYIEIYESQFITDPTDVSTFESQETLPATAGCEPLTLSVSPAAGSLDVKTVVTATTDVNLSSNEVVNIFSGGTFLHDCTTAKCVFDVAPGPGVTIYTADVGLPQTKPYSPATLVSARSKVQRSIGPTRSAPTTCPAQSCQ